MYENQPTKTSVVMQHIKVQSFCAFEDKPPKNISCRYLKNQSSYIHLYIYIYIYIQRHEKKNISCFEYSQFVF